MNTIKILIPNRMIGSRIDIALSEMLPNHSRSKISALIKSKNILLNDKPFKPKGKILGNEIITFENNQKVVTSWSPEKIPLDIIFEDSHIIVINKPYGLVTHPGAGNWMEL